MQQQEGPPMGEQVQRSEQQRGKGQQPRQERTTRPLNLDERGKTPAEQQTEFVQRFGGDRYLYYREIYPREEDAEMLATSDQRALENRVNNGFVYYGMEPHLAANPVMSDVFREVDRLGNYGYLNPYPASGLVDELNLAEEQSIRDATRNPIKRRLNLISYRLHGGYFGGVNGEGRADRFREGLRDFGIVSTLDMFDQIQQGELPRLLLSEREAAMSLEMLTAEDLANLSDFGQSVVGRYLPQNAELPAASEDITQLHESFRIFVDRFATAFSSADNYMAFDQQRQEQGLDLYPSIIVNAMRYVDILTQDLHERPRQFPEYSTRAQLEALASGRPDVFTADDVAVVPEEGAIPPAIAVLAPEMNSVGAVEIHSGPDSNAASVVVTDVPPVNNRAAAVEIRSEPDAPTALVVASDARLAGQEPPTVVNEEAPLEIDTTGIPTDIAEGIRKILLTEMPDAVSRGSTNSLTIDLRNLQQFLEHLDTMTPEASLRPTDARLGTFKQAVERAVRANITQGFENIFKLAEMWASQGSRDHVLEQTGKVHQILELAQKFDIRLAIIPEGREGDTGQGERRPLQTSDEITRYMDERVNRLLAQGLQYNIDTIRNVAFSGEVPDINKIQAGLFEWMDFMESRGVPVVLQDEAGGSADSAALVSPKDVAKRIIDREVRKVLSKNLERVLATAAFQISHPNSGPFDVLIRDRAAYVALGQRYGLINYNLPEVIVGEQFNPNLLDREMTRIMQQNLEAGFQHIQEYHLQQLRMGVPSQVRHITKVMDEYIELARTYGVREVGGRRLNPTQLHNSLEAHFTVANMQQGVNALYADIRMEMQKSPSNAKQAARRLEEFRAFAQEVLGSESRDLDFSAADRYIKDHAIGAPQIAN